MPGWRRGQTCVKTLSCLQLNTKLFPCLKIRNSEVKSGWSSRFFVTGWATQITQLLLSRKNVENGIFKKQWCEKCDFDGLSPCRKIGPCLHRIIGIRHPMVHTKFQGHQPFGSGEENLLMFTTNMGMAAILKPGPLNKLSFPYPMEAPYEIWLWLTQWFQRRRCLGVWTTDDRRRTTDDEGLPIL